MFYIENVKQCIGLLDRLEQKSPCFSQEEKQGIYRVAFHMEQYGEIEKLVLQMAAPHVKAEDRSSIMRRYLIETPEFDNSTAVQIENYIFQLHSMAYEKEKANRMLEDLLQKNDIKYDLDTLVQQLKEGQQRKEASR